MKKLLTFLLNLTIIMGLCVTPAYAAPDWPANIAIQAEGGIVIDADTGAVIFGKNIHQQYFPASITKILTALIVLERCDMDEIVTFSHNAVYNVESGSSNANLEAGDQLTVRDTLYAMTLKSANEAANALAEHTAGSIEAFADLMNEKAEELGCQNSHFSNPSGLNGADHYTTAYDMALISKAAFSNEAFVEIDATLSYALPPTKRNAEGLTIYPGHRMMKKNQSVYYEGIIGGKTGYTMLAGNTLVTCAQRDGMKLVAVILNGHQTHYPDTKVLLDFGFKNFKSIRISDYDKAYTNIESDLAFAGLPATDLSILSFSKDSRITLPSGADFSDAQSTISYEMNSSDPENAAARINYTYNDRKIGTAYLMRSESNVAILQPEAETTSQAAPDSQESAPADTAAPTQALSVRALPEATTVAPLPIDTTPFEIPPVVFKAVLSVLITGGLIAALVLWRIRASQKEEASRRLRQERRQQRLQELGVTTTDFEQMLEDRRSRAGIVTSQPRADEPDDVVHSNE